MKLDPVPLGGYLRDITLLDPSDSNFYCGVCKVSLKTRFYYRLHCANDHHMKISCTISHVHILLKNANTLHFKYI